MKQQYTFHVHAPPCADPDSRGAMAPAFSDDYHGKLCPVCGAHLARLPRTVVDHVLSAFLPMRRYACKSKTCAWQGLLRHRATGAEGDAAPGLRDRVIEPARMQATKRS